MSSIAIIEYQTQGGNWQRICDCANKPAIIKAVMDGNFKSNSNYQKIRAIDAQTKQLIDISFRT